MPNAPYSNRYAQFLRFGVEIGVVKITNFFFSKLISLAKVRNWSWKILILMVKFDQKMGTDIQRVSEL